MLQEKEVSRNFRSGNPRHVRFMQRLKFFFGAAAGLAILAYFSFNQYGIIQRFETHGEFRTLQNEIAEQKKKQSEIRNTLERLQSDYDYIEKIARERYYLIKKGETVYWIRRN